QALRADFLHHALHRRVDRADRAMRWQKIRRQHIVAGGCDRRHHLVRADGDDAVAGVEGNRLVAKPPARVSAHRLDDVADERAILRTRRREARPFVAAPDHGIGGGLDVIDLVAIDDAPVTGEIEYFRAAFTIRATDREQHRIAEAPAD